MLRPWRGAIWEIEIERASAASLEVDGAAVERNLIPLPRQPGGRHRVRATFT